MGKEEFMQRLETLRKPLSEEGFFSVIWNMLDKDPSEEERDILEAWLIAYASLDPDRVAKYWEPFLYSENPIRREMTVVRLSTLTGLKPDGLASRILTEFLGEEPTEDKIDDIIKERFLRLFPVHKGGE